MPTLASVASSTGEIQVARDLFAIGDYDEVLSVVKAIAAREGLDAETGFNALQLKACVEYERKQYKQSLGTLKTIGPMVDDLPPALKARFYGQRALANRNLNNLDSALVDYEAARYWAQESSDQKTEASIRNNLGKVYNILGRVDEALAEVDAAIRIAQPLHDDDNLGRYYDTKAQILVGQGRYTEALSCSNRALGLLNGLPVTHTAVIEARATHGRAMIGLGATFLEQPDPIGTFCARREASALLPVSLDRETVQSALAQSEGHVLKAAELLCVRHSALIRAIEKYGIERKPKRTRRKPLIKK